MAKNVGNVFIGFELDATKVVSSLRTVEGQLRTTTKATVQAGNKMQKGIEVPVKAGAQSAGKAVNDFGQSVQKQGTVVQQSFRQAGQSSRDLSGALQDMAKAGVSSTESLSSALSNSRAELVNLSSKTSMGNLDTALEDSANRANTLGARAKDAGVKLGNMAKTSMSNLGKSLGEVSGLGKELSGIFQEQRNSLLGLSQLGRIGFVAMAGAITAAVMASAKFADQMAEVSTMVDSWNTHLIPGMAAGIKSLSV